ncbi:MAG: malonyl-CoA decarboxylase [Oceanospirillum sp.]|nr:malonyl-CoA decarboxylase [Oceanospirillum sp.]
MQAKESSILEKTILKLLPLWRDSNEGRRSRDQLELSEDLTAADEQVLKQWIDACLSDEGGEVAARAKAAALGNGFLSLSDKGRMRFLKLLSEHYGTNEQQLSELIQQWQSTSGNERSQLESSLRAALEPVRMKLLTQFSELPQGVKFLVDMRAELLALKKEAPELTPLEQDLKRLLTSWFDIGLLQLEQITWHSSAEILEKLIAYEAVHAIRSWDDLKNRLDSDRRCFAFFHPSMPNEPLIFVEVALVNGLSDNVQHLLDISAPVEDIKQADTAIFYSISNAQKGLAGISFGNFLIKRVVKLLQAEFPQLQQFSTLSPIPGLCRWIQKDPDLLAELSWLEKLQSQQISDAQITPAQKEQLMTIAAYYLSSVRQQNKHGRAGSAKDPVAHFHLSNGAQLERLNWMADSSVNGLKQSGGLMVNYLYKLEKIESNSRKYSEQGTINISGKVRKLLKAPALKLKEAS